MRTLLAAATLILTATAVRAECIVADPSQSPLNVRTFPNGLTIGTLENGKAVAIIDKATDEKGQAWVYVSDRGTAKPLGWVFTDYVACEGAASSTKGTRETLVLQFGNSSYPEVIQWSPDGRWFLTATRSDVVLWDAGNGSVLRTIDLPREMRSVGLTTDGKTILARDASGKTLAWNAETGDPAPVQAGSPQAVDWLPDFGTGSERAKRLKSEAARKFVAENGMTKLIPGEVENIVVIEQVGEIVSSKLGDSRFTSLVGLADPKRVATFKDDSDEGGHLTECGNPETFAFHSERLAVAPAAHDASYSFSNAAVYALDKAGPKRMWEHFCRGSIVSSIGMERGQIVSAPYPGLENRWDAWNARPLRLNRKVDPNDDSFLRDAYDASGDKAASPDGRYRLVHQENSELVVIRDTRTGKQVSFDEKIHFAEDSIHAWSADDEEGSMSVTLWNLRTGRMEWRATEEGGDGSYKRAVLVVEFPDGKFRLSQGAEKFVRVVDGFSSRPFTKADAAKFVK